MTENQTNGQSHPAELLKRHFLQGLQAIDPLQWLPTFIQKQEDGFYCDQQFYRFADYTQLWVIGAGKACARMARALEAILADHINNGLIIVKYGHTEPLHYIRQYQAAHPLPDQAGIDATQKLLQLLSGADQQTLVICLLSGGASALLVSPTEGVTLADKQQLTQHLLKAGADIQTLNRLRQRLSQVKAGGLARAIYPAQLLTLVMSDVIADDPQVIGSAPTLTPSQVGEIQPLITQYGLNTILAPQVLPALQQPAPSNPALPQQQYRIVLNLNALLQQLEQQLAPTPVLRWPHFLQGEAEQQAQVLAQWALQQWQQLPIGQSLCLVAGGETTVTVTGNGLGGRNQHLALAFALNIAGHPGITLLAAGSDGSDGPTDATGAIVDGNTVALAQQHGLDAATELTNHNSYHFFQQLDQRSDSQHHLITGPTGVNVMDVVLIWLGV